MAKAVLALSIALLGAGCVTVRSEPPSFTGAWPPTETGPRPAITLRVTGRASEDGMPRDIGPILDSWGAQTARAYRESALFSDVSLRSGRSDLRIDVELRGDVRQNQALTAFSYLTLLVIPQVAATDIAVTTQVTTDGGQPLGAIQVRGRSYTWSEILLMFFWPFFQPQTVTPGMVYDLNRQTIAELHARGVL